MFRYCTIAFFLFLAHSLFAQDFGKYMLRTRNLDSINSPANDYAPWVNTEDTRLLYYTSNRFEDSSFVFCVQIQTTENKEPIPPNTQVVFYSPKRKNVSSNVWGTMSHRQRTPSKDEFSPPHDGYAYCYASNAKDSYGNMDIYYAHQDWVKFAQNSFRGVHHEYNLGANVNSPFWDAQPCVSDDGNTIYFVSNRYKSNRTDIYVTHRITDSTWTDAQALGMNINSTADERSPFLSRNGKLLFFARDVGGEKRNYDLFVCQRQDTTTEEWSQPQRLPEPINSDYDDMYLHAPEQSDVFYFCSNRPGGKGGLDIYECSPNIFSGRTVQLSACATDSITGCGIAATLRVTDSQSGALLLESDSAGCHNLRLLDGREYDLSLSYRGVVKSIHYTATDSLPHNNTAQQFQARFNGTTFDFSEYTIPFFVTGYYRLNTVQGLQELFTQKKGRLRNISYIEQFEENSPTYESYRQHARTAESIFNRLVRTAVDTVFPCILGSGTSNEYVELRIYGYADPKPIIGRFTEDRAMTYEDSSAQRFTVKKGDVLNNTILSGLRAAYATEYINTVFREQSAQYRSLQEQGRIVLRSIAGNNNNSSSDDAAQRRIRIEFERKRR